MLETQPLHANAKLYMKLLGIIYFGIYSVMILIGLIVISLIRLTFPEWWLVIGSLAIIAMLAYVLIVFYPNKKFERTRWRFDQQGLHIFSGIWWRKQNAVPRSRVQHIDVSQGPLQRQYQLAELVVHTAGTLNASVTLIGLSFEKAVEIRDELLNQDNGDAV